MQTVQVLQTHAMVLKNEQENTHNNVIEGDIRRDMTVDMDQKYQEKLNQLPICFVK